MTPRDLACFIGPLVSPAARDRLRLLATGQTTDIALRYDEVLDWNKLGKLLTDKVEELQMYDGQEWFTVETAKPQ